jgi:hypothetical protein
VRDFHVAERAQDAADIKLREAVQKASRINETRRSERNLLGGQAELERIAVVEALRARQQATKALLLRLDALDIVLAARSPEGNQPTLLNYQQKLRRPVEDGDTQIGTWIELAEPFLIRVNWTPEHIDTFVIIAKGIEQDFSTDTWPPATAAGGTASPSKRKRQSENRESRSKVVRRPGDANASGCRSADAGAEESRPRSARAPATSQNSRQARPDEPVRHDHAAFCAQPSPQQATNDGQPAPDAAPGLLPAPLPLPTIGVAGNLTAMLRDRSPNHNLPYLSWCRRQIVMANFQTLDEVEPLAQALQLYFENTLRDHEWEHEDDVRLPVTPTDFRNGRLFPNVHRLHRMVQNAPDELDDYCFRNLTRGGIYFSDANETAGRIILLIQEKGPAHDWNTENDLFRDKQDPDTTKGLPIESLNGHWNVSIHICMPFNSTRPFTDTSAAHGHCWRGR